MLQLEKGLVAALLEKVTEVSVLVVAILEWVTTGACVFAALLREVADVNVLVAVNSN